MRRQLILVLAVAMANIASADIIQGIDIDFVTIGNPGNPGDTRAEANPTGCGAVGYTYQLGQYEITNGQWDSFVTAAGAPTGNPSDAYDESADWTGDNIPIDELRWYEAVQFCNYLTSGDKSQGAYQFSGNNSNPGDFEGIDRDSAVSTYGIAYVIPTEDEWYKAAYYTGSGYSTYANGTDIAPIAGDDTNYDQDSPYDGPWDVGSGTLEQNGTFDMMGNGWEWNETLISGSEPVVRGGSFDCIDYLLSSSSRPAPRGGVGFRVASVPEPCSLVLLSLGGLTLMRRRRVR